MFDKGVIRQLDLMNYQCDACVPQAGFGRHAGQTKKRGSNLGFAPSPYHSRRFWDLLICRYQASVNISKKPIGRTQAGNFSGAPAPLWI